MFKMSQELDKNPCEVCLVRTMCNENCQDLREFGDYLREKNGGKPLGSYIWLLEYEKRSRILEKYPIKIE